MTSNSPKHAAHAMSQQTSAPSSSPVRAPGNTSYIPPMTGGRASSARVGGAPGMGSAVYGNPHSVPSEESNKKSTRTIIKVVTIIVALLIVAYIAGVIVFSNLFYPRSSFAGTDVSLKNPQEITEAADRIASNYTINVSGAGLNFTVTSSDAEMTIDGKEVARESIASQNAYAWPIEVFKTHDLSRFLSSEYNENGLETFVKQQVAHYNESATAPVDASVAYSSSKGFFEVVPEKQGTQVDDAVVLQAVDNTINELGTQVAIDDTALLKPKVLQSDDALIAAAEQANSYLKAKFDLVLGTTAIPAGSIDSSVISDWVTIGDDLSVTFDSDMIAGWVKEFASKVDTVGTSRPYTTASGDTIQVSGGTYGWKVDTDKLTTAIQDAVSQGSTDPLTVPTKSEGYTWNGVGKPDWGAHAEVDISEQHAWFFDIDGNLVWDSAVVTGKPGHDTTLGIFKIFKHQSPATLTGSIIASTGKPEYVTEVKYWMQFTYDGIGFHDATWQSSFGGSRYTNGAGSHGCVNLPLDKASALFDLISIGNAVIVHE